MQQVCDVYQSTWLLIIVFRPRSNLPLYMNCSWEIPSLHLTLANDLSYWGLFFHHIPMSIEGTSNWCQYIGSISSMEFSIFVIGSTASDRDFAAYSTLLFYICVIFYILWWDCFLIRMIIFVCEIFFSFSWLIAIYHKHFFFVSFVSKLITISRALSLNVCSAKI